jgi:hypothetical protein
MSLRDKILQAQDCPSEAVFVPEWDCTVYVKRMSGKERDALDAETSKKPKDEAPEVWSYRLLTAAIVDENGQRVFTAEDVEALQSKCARATSELFLKACKVNGYVSTEVAEKNSKSGQSA